MVVSNSGHVFAVSGGNTGLQTPDPRCMSPASLQSGEGKCWIIPAGVGRLQILMLLTPQKSGWSWPPSMGLESGLSAYHILDGSRHPDLSSLIMVMIHTITGSPEMKPIHDTSESWFSCLLPKVASGPELSPGLKSLIICCSSQHHCSILLECFFLETSGAILLTLLPTVDL